MSLSCGFASPRIPGHGQRRGSSVQVLVREIAERTALPTRKASAPPPSGAAFCRPCAWRSLRRPGSSYSACGSPSSARNLLRGLCASDLISVYRVILVSPFPHGTKFCEVSGILSQGATIFLAQTDFIRLQVDEDFLPLQKCLLFFFPAPEEPI